MNHNIPKISIIVPVYNVEPYLRQCLNSLVNQTLKDIEIICVNDGSPDDCLSILHEHAEKDNRIAVINQKNTGLSGARNSGLKVASGEYVMFVDSDDWVDVRICEELYNAALRENADYYADFSQTGAKDMLDKAKEFLKKTEKILSSAGLSRQLKNMV